MYTLNITIHAQPVFTSSSYASNTHPVLPAEPRLNRFCLLRTPESVRPYAQLVVQAGSSRTLIVKKILTIETPAIPWDPVVSPSDRFYCDADGTGGSGAASATVR